jgi:hypothetical protein
MKAVEFIRTGLEQSTGATLRAIDDMKDKPLTFPTPKGGNHPLWVMGHLAWTEGAIRELMLGTPNPYEKWKPIFGFGSEPSADASKYPSLEEAKKAFIELRAQTTALLGKLKDEDLDRASEKCPPEFKGFVGTYALCLLALMSNQMTHYGQVCDARRAAGRKPMGM